MTRYVYDNNWRVRAVLAPTGEAAVYDYDPAGNVTAIRRLRVNACEALEFNPQQGTSGALVTIYGVGFGGQVSGVSFNGVAAVAFFHLQVQLWGSQLALIPEAEWVVINELIPARYLERAAKKRSTAEQRAKAEIISVPILTRIREPAGVLGRLTTEERAMVERVAQECADLFQRSSSCVEGRNGQLALRHHSLHRQMVTHTGNSSKWTL
ncbi:MAG TPA: DUF6399 domain-containing protein [Blastocatellia bacterium]